MLMKICGSWFDPKQVQSLEPIENRDQDGTKVNVAGGWIEIWEHEDVVAAKINAALGINNHESVRYL